MQLVIVRRNQFAAFHRLSQAFADEADVRLVWDRRANDDADDRRRQTFSSGADKRLGRDRRRDPLAGWGDRDYVITQGTDGVLVEVQQQAIPSAHLIAMQVAGRDLRHDLEAAVGSDINVLITGGDPISREALARRIHRWSDRHDRPFVVLDRRGAAELFGRLVVPDAAAAPPRGRLCRCPQPEAGLRGAGAKQLEHGGTLLLEEVVDLSWEQQTELLSYLEQRAVRADGTGTGCACAPRVIAASSSWLLDRVASAEFRADLFYRLNLIHVVLPPGMSRHDAPMTT
jgi:transcriptional regulator of acetoin/glycerol metabolism